MYYSRKLLYIFLFVLAIQMVPQSASAETTFLAAWDPSYVETTVGVPFTTAFVVENQGSEEVHVNLTVIFDGSFAVVTQSPEGWEKPFDNVEFYNWTGDLQPGRWLLPFTVKTVRGGRGNGTGSVESNSASLTIISEEPSAFVFMPLINR